MPESFHLVNTTSVVTFVTVASLLYMWKIRYMQHRRLKGAILSAVLLLGGVLSPLAHFVYMAAADAHASHGHTGSHAHHDATTEDASIGEAGSDAVACTYAELFATQMAADTPPATEVAAPSFIDLELGLQSVSERESRFLTASIRGPPSPSVAVS